MKKFGFLSRHPAFKYLSDSDKYLAGAQEPEIKFNVIGTGMNGREHIRVTLLEGRATIHGVFDPDPLSIQGAKDAYSQYVPQGSLVIYDSLEEACCDPDVDGLIICTPNYTHIDVVRQAIKSGKHILLEKPMATTIPDAYEIAQLAQSYDAVFQIGLQYRYKSFYLEAIYEALERQSIGDIKTARILKHRFPFLDKVKQWNKFSKYSGGTLVEKCCHYFDILNLVAQSKPTSVFATGSMAVNFLDLEYDGEKSDIIDNAFVTVMYENGVRASFDLCMFSPVFQEEIILCGDEGRLRAYTYHDSLAASAPKTHLEVMRGGDKPSRVTSPHYPTFIAEAGHGGATFFEHVNFVDNIEGKETDTATAEEGFWSIVVGVAAEESVKTGNPVAIDELLERNGIDH